MSRILSVLLALCLPGAAGAQAVLDCFGYQASALAIPEPWEDHTRTFANGEVRVTLMDTVEPAAGALYLMIQAPPRDEMGNRNCAVIGLGESGVGFSGLYWTQLDAGYEPGRGLVIGAPVDVYSNVSGGFDPGFLTVTINQATGDITPVLQLP